MEDFYRIRRLPPYVFEQVNRAKAFARNGGADIIDLGMGNPDLPAPAHVVEKLKETIGKPRTDRYSASKGIPGLRRAQAAYYARRFGVKLNPETQIVTTLGSKEGFANVAQAIAAPGDIIIVPNPTYPIHVFGFLMAGGAIRAVPVEPDPALTTIPLLAEAIYLASLDGPIDLAAAAGRDWIAASPGTLCHTMTLRVAQAAGYTPRIRHHVDDFVAALALVAAGQGLALVPELAAADPPPAVHLTPLPTRRHTFLACRRGAEDHPAIAAAITALRHPAQDPSYR